MIISRKKPEFRKWSSSVFGSLLRVQSSSCPGAEIAYRNELIIALADAFIEMTIFFENQYIEGKMDKQIKKAKKSIDKKMDHLVKEDIKRDKKCDDAMMMKKKKK